MNRFLEIAATVLGSAFASALVATWSVASKIERATTTVEMHDRRLTIVENSDSRLVADVAELRARQAGDDRFRQELTTRLERIETLQSDTLKEIRRSR